MDDKNDYDALLKEFRDLQLRVTRFSSVEQQLINTRDRLDQELELYKRLNRFQSASLTSKTREDFLRLVAEAVVDILEVECSLVCLMDFKNEELDELQSEGFKIPEDQFAALKTQLLEIKETCPADRVFPVSDKLFERVPVLKQFTTGLAYRYESEELGFAFCIAGFNSESKASLYPKLEQSHETIFSIFTKQISALLINLSNTITIGDQLETIKKSEHEMRRLSLIATKTINGVVIADSFGRIEWVNAAFTRITGYQLNEVVGRKPKEFLQGPASDPKVLAQLKTALEKKENVSVTLINYNKSGQPYYNQLEIISVFDDAGRHLNFLAVQRDVTSDFKYQAEIVSINKRFELVSKNTGIGIFEWDIATDSLVWNEALFAQYGASSAHGREDCLAIYNASIHPEDRDRVFNQTNVQISEKQQFLEMEFRIIRRDNAELRHIRLSSTLEHDERGVLIGLIGTSIDFTASKNYEETIVAKNSELLQINEKLDQNNYIFELISSKINMGIYMFNPQTNQLAWNDVLVGQYGVSREKIGNDYFGFWINSIVPEDRGRVIATTQQLMAQGTEPIEQEFRIVRSDTGEERIINGLAIVERDADGKLRSLTGTSVDVTEVRQYEAQMLSKNQELSKINSELDNFVYSISHDLRSPLLSIQGLLTLAMKSPGLDDKIMQYLRLADQSAGRLDETIKEILDYSRNARLEAHFNSFDMRELVEQIFADLRFADNQSLDMSFVEQGSSIIYSDKLRMTILLKNIIGNAVKYKRKTIADAFVKFVMARDEQSLIFTIHDNGEGIQAKHVEKIFDMFYRATHTGVGTGLGLYICQEIIKKLQGSIDVASVFGEGTTVTIKIPLIHEPIL